MAPKKGSRKHRSRKAANASAKRSESDPESESEEVVQSAHHAAPVSVPVVNPLPLANLPLLPAPPAPAAPQPPASAQSLAPSAADAKSLLDAKHTGIASTAELLQLQAQIRELSSRQEALTHALALRPEAKTDSKDSKSELKAAESKDLKPINTRSLLPTFPLGSVTSNGDASTVSGADIAHSPGNVMHFALSVTRGGNQLSFVRWWYDTDRSDRPWTDPLVREESKFLAHMCDLLLEHEYTYDGTVESLLNPLGCCLRRLNAFDLVRILGRRDITAQAVEPYNPWNRTAAALKSVGAQVHMVSNARDQLFKPHRGRGGGGSRGGGRGGANWSGAHSDVAVSQAATAATALPASAATTSFAAAPFHHSHSSGRGGGHNRGGYSPGAGRGGRGY